MIRYQNRAYKLKSSYFYCRWKHTYYRFSGSIVSNKNRLLSYYSYCIPKPRHIKNKKYGKITPNFGYAGEDSFFTFKLNISKLKQDNDTIANNDTNNNEAPLFFIGVADGVGSWKPDKAKEAAKYSQELMLSGIKYLSSISFNDICNDSTTFHCYNLSHKIAQFSSNTVDKMALQGASTLCLLNFKQYHGNDETNQFKCHLNAFNLGDSGFNIYRHKSDHLRTKTNDCYEVIYKSPAQEQGFGIPYQLGSHATSNSIDDGYCLEQFNLKSLDIVIVGSDGLWDNLWDHETSDIICQTMTSYYANWSDNGNKLTFNNYVHNQIVNGDLTHRIMKQAYQNSIDKKKSSPWSDAMTETVDMIYDGGKPDDITCVVVFIH